MADSGQVLISHDFSSGVPSSFTVDNPSLVDTVMSPAGGPKPSALRIRSQTISMTQYSNWWNTDFGNELQHGVSLVVPATDEWTTLEVWTYAEVDDPGLVDDPYWYTGTYALLRRTRASDSVENSLSGADAYRESYSYYEQSGWTQHVINMSPQEVEITLHLDIAAYAYWDNSSAPPTGLSNANCKVYYSDLVISRFPTKVRDIDWKFTADDGDAFQWWRGWSDWITDTTQMVWPKARYTNNHYSREVLFVDTGGFPGIPWDAGTAEAVWSEAAAGNGDHSGEVGGYASPEQSNYTHRKDAFHTVNVEEIENFGFNLGRYTTFGTGSFTDDAEYNSAINQQTVLYDFNHIGLWHHATASYLFGSVGVLWGNTNVNDPNAAKLIPEEHRDPVYNDGEQDEYRKAPHRSWISYGEHRTALHEPLSIEASAPTVYDLHDNNGELFNLNPTVHIHWVSPAIDLETVPKTSSWPTTGSTTDPVGFYPWHGAGGTILTSAVRGAGFNVPLSLSNLATGELWLSYLFAEKDGSYGSIWNSSDPDGLYEHGRTGPIASGYLKSLLLLRPWRYWLEYELDHVFDLECPPHLRLLQRQDPALGQRGNVAMTENCNKALRLVGRGEVNQNLKPGKSPRVYLPNSYF